MLPVITTTHAVPQEVPASNGFSEESVVRCCYCYIVLGVSIEGKGRDDLRKHHRCKAKRMNKKPAASIPYN
jgi:hypothetical protein